MILGTLGIGLATFVGMVAGHTNFILVLFAACSGFIYGMLSLQAAGRRLGDAAVHRFSSRRLRLSLFPLELPRFAPGW